MRLSERLRAAEGRGTAAPPTAATAVIDDDLLDLGEPPDRRHAAPLLAPTPPPHIRDVVAVDPLDGLKNRARDVLYARLGTRINDASLDEEQLRALVTRELQTVIDADPAPLTPQQRQRILHDLTDDILGYGPLERFLADPAVSEVMVNGPAAIYVERGGRLHRTEARFADEEQLRRIIERIVGRVGRRIDESSPMVDARLPDGSRVNAVIPPLAVDGPSVTIRKFSPDRWTAEDLVSFGTFTAELATFLAACVRGRMNVLVTGGTGTGKTTLLNVLSSFIPASERIVTIEDAVELQLRQDHVVRLESRPPNIEGRGEVAIRDLVRNALRMRPDRIVIGEVRGGEALDMLQAMNTGHAGSLGTVHANSPRDALTRLETMVLMAGLDLPARAVREQVAAAIDLVVHIARARNGSRRVTHVTEVVGLEGQVISTQDLFLTAGGPGGLALPTGIRPHLSGRLEAEGVSLEPGLFVLPEDWQ